MGNYMDVDIDNVILQIVTLENIEIIISISTIVIKYFLEYILFNFFFIIIFLSLLIFITFNISCQKKKNNISY
jgi:hypothetical protein